MSTPAAQIADLNKETATLTAERAALPTGPTPENIDVQKRAALAPIESAITAEGKQLPTPPGQAQLPNAPNQPLVDPGEYSKFSAMLVAMAVIAGAKSNNWYGVSHSLNGALRGYLEGSQEKADQAWKKYQADYTKAVEAHKEQQQEYLDTLENKKLTINQKFQEWSMTAAKYDDQEKLALARQRRFDDMSKSIIGMKEHTASLSIMKEKIDEQVKKAQEGQKAASDSAIGMVDAGMPLNVAVPGFGKDATSQRAAVRDAWAAKYVTDHPGSNSFEAGQELARRQVAYLAERSSVGQLTKMLGATRPAVKQLEFNIQQATDEMAKLPSSDLSPVINAIARGEQKWTGDPAYYALFYYMSGAGLEAARLQSNGQASIQQLHEGAAEEARKWANIDMTPASWKGVSEAMIKEGHARIQQFDESIREAEGQQGTLPAAAHQPYSDPEKEARYQAWKAEHASQ